MPRAVMESIVLYFWLTLFLFLLQAKYISTCIDEIKQELKQDNIAVKANAVCKLTYVRASIVYILSDLLHNALSSSRHLFFCFLLITVADAWLWCQLGCVQHRGGDELLQIHI